ncbi:hypothetical protein AVEN_272696-1 [Araneus ventricosus]|uniref:Uncharacterized protein n=1 Tax=Araneus ventricosus TaxID=182803 RepID=A0A4Y2LCA5_ARAVE|nr:hypothetical protein AVEN_272696-1 [Araneus ventricosus]
MESLKTSLSPLKKRVKRKALSKAEMALESNPELPISDIGDKGARITGEINPLANIYLFIKTLSNPPTNRRLKEAVVGDWPKMMKFKAL